MKIKLIQNFINLFKGNNSCASSPSDVEYIKNKKAICVIGDSHVNFFSGNEQISFVHFKHGINNCSDKLSSFKTFHVGPALAYNLNKYKTKTQAREKIEYLMRKKIVKPNDDIIFCFGWIDVRAHVLKQAKVQNKDYKIIINNILANYIKFLLKYKKRYKVHVWGIISTLKDIPAIDPSFADSGSETERNEAGEYFNIRMEQLCKENEIGFISIFSNLINEDYTSKSEYLEDDNCHLSQRAWILAEKELKKHFDITENLVELAMQNLK